tara:strand:- start:1 stop:870 length:870 start_codon:yes stop_codon:yes gene_type:complete
MVSFINSPDYIMHQKDVSELKAIKKLLYLILGFVISFFHDNTSGKTFTRSINLLLRKKSKLNYENGMYYASDNSGKFYFPNKRVVRMLNGIVEQSNELFDLYCLDKITFSVEDKVIDCGANTGELYPYLKKVVPRLEYLAFEPDQKVYNCLLKNVNDKKATLRSEALSNKSGMTKFYNSTYSADSSLVYSGEKSYTEVKTIQLDDLELTNIKLLKMDAEGHELEVLKGALRTLSQIMYISVDFGPEKGEQEERTLPEVSNFLYENNFKMVYANNLRDIGLFLNINHYQE